MSCGAIAIGKAGGQPDQRNRVSHLVRNGVLCNYRIESMQQGVPFGEIKMTDIYRQGIFIYELKRETISVSFLMKQYSHAV